MGNNPADYELRYSPMKDGEEAKNHIWGGIKKKPIKELPNPIAEYEIKEIYDSINWNVITTSLLVEMEKLRDRIVELEAL
jgi:hypothetical protein